MKPLFQLSTRRYSEELVLVKKAMDDLESNCKVKDGFQIKEPFEKAGWTFFNLELSADIVSVIENSGMMENAGGFSISEQIKNFLGHFLESKGSNVRITKLTTSLRKIRKSQLIKNTEYSVLYVVPLSYDRSGSGLHRSTAIPYLLD